MGEKPAFAALQVGDEIPPFRRTTDLAHWNRYAAVNYEFIPLHMDAEAARAVGQKDVFGMGNLRISYLHNGLYDWLGGAGDIVDFQCEFRGLNFKGDALSSRATITGKDERSDRKLLSFDLAVENQDGKNTAPGKATVLFFDSGKATVMPDPSNGTPVEKPEVGKYLDQATIDRIGETGAPATSLPVGENDIRRWAIATYYPKKPPASFYFEEEAAKGPWGALVAPREFNPFAWMPDLNLGVTWLRGIGVEPGERVLNGGQRSRYFQPIRPGDRITSVARFANAYERDGRLGTMLFLVSEFRWTNQKGELVRIGESSMIYY